MLYQSLMQKSESLIEKKEKKYTQSELLCLPYKYATLY